MSNQTTDSIGDLETERWIMSSQERKSPAQVVMEALVAVATSAVLGKVFAFIMKQNPESLTLGLEDLNFDPQVEVGEADLRSYDWQGGGSVWARYRQEQGPMGLVYVVGVKIFLNPAEYVLYQDYHKNASSPPVLYEMFCRHCREVWMDQHSSGGTSGRGDEDTINVPVPSVEGDDGTLLEVRFPTLPPPRIGGEHRRSAGHLLSVLDDDYDY